VNPDLSDGAVHTAKIDYTPGQFQVILDSVSVLNVSDPSLDLTSLLALPGNTDAYVGFTAATGGGGQENHDLLNWSFTAVPVPAAMWALLAGLAVARRRRHRSTF
jgi:hypothetical protein